MKNITKKRENEKIFFLLTAGLAIILCLIGVLFAIPTFGTNYGTTSYSSEDQSSLFSYNFTANVTESGDPDTPWVFSIYSVNSSLYSSQHSPSFYNWMNIDSATGVLTFNTTHDNQTGRFNMSIDVKGASGQGESRNFYFVVNATNDAPNITLINNSYPNSRFNMTVNRSFLIYVNGSDEEMHWPLVFNISFYNNCTKYPWNNRADCNLFNMANVSVNASIMNYTPTRYDAGTYWANLSVTDFGKNYSCSSGYCSSDYSQNKTGYYPQIIQFNIYPYLEINVTDCQNKIFQENQSGSCIINFTTRELGDNITYMSNATLRNYAGNVTNRTWFFNSGSNFTSNYTNRILINVTPSKNAIGNWTINFSARDINFSEDSYELIYVYVNKTLNDIPRIDSIANVNTSTSLSTRINITVYDDDHLIPDKQVFNESIRFIINVTNLTSSGQEFNFTFYNFTVQILNSTISGTNRTEAKIEFTPNSTMAGDYKVNITAIDNESAMISTIFNLSIKNNLAPQWNATMDTTFIIFENNLTYFNFSKNASDPNSDILNFTYSSDSYFPSFSINITTGIVNFTPADLDVGQHILVVNITDGYLVNSTTFNFTVLNVNDTPDIVIPVEISGASSIGNSTFGMNATENYTALISLYVDDEDFKILSGQKYFYNESLSINLSISGPNSSLFTFIRNPSYPTNASNRSLFEASFTPSRSDVGNYTVQINVSDKTNLSDFIQFNLTINSSAHAPVMSALANLTSAVNRTLYYRINASDFEDGNSTDSGNSNFTFTYQFLNGADFINNNSSIFNRTTGVLNITFNSSQGGIYRLNMTVNDSTGLNSSRSFWIFVYNVPVLISPAASSTFNLIENITYLLNFTLNHTIQDNLTYEFYIQTARSNVYKYNISSFGNATAISWNYSVNLSDETAGIKNLTLIAYPTTSELTNASQLNTTLRWNLTINHTNYPLAFSSNIGGANRSISGGSPQQVVLSDYFTDIDASDVYHNQTITFSYSTTAVNGTITVEIINWQNATTPVMTFSATSSASANYSVIAYEYNESNSSQIISNLTSNIFNIALSVTPTVQTVVSGGGGGGSSVTSVPYALKIIVPAKISAYTNQRITIPLKLTNNGKETFKDINLEALAYKDGKTENVIKTSFDKTYISSLAPGKSEDAVMTVIFSTNKTGDYEITVSAISKTPSYTDWAKIYINLQKVNESEVKKYLLFVEEYLVQNPSCLELEERLKETDDAIDKGDYATARITAESVLNACKEHVSQVSLPTSKITFRNAVLQYIVIAIFISFFAGILYYYIKRRRFRNPKKFYEQNKAGEKVNKLKITNM